VRRSALCRRSGMHTGLVVLEDRGQPFGRETLAGQRAAGWPMSEQVIPQQDGVAVSMLMKLSCTAFTLVRRGYGASRRTP